MVTNETRPKTASPVWRTITAVFSRPTSAINGVPTTRKIVPSTTALRSAGSRTESFRSTPTEVTWIPTALILTAGRTTPCG